MCDLDVGEMFLNFILHRSIRPLAGVDLTHCAPDGARRVVWECWQRAAMGRWMTICNLLDIVLERSHPLCK
jgi:hypothetical protein